MIERPASEPTISDPSFDEPIVEPIDASPGRDAPLDQPRKGRYIGPLRITFGVIVVALAFVASLGFLAWVVLAVEEDQIPLLAAGFVVLGASFAATAIGTLLGMWRAASRAEGGRALLLAIVGGIAGLAAIGCFTVTALSALVWNT